MHSRGFFASREILRVYFFEITSRRGSGETYTLFLLESALKQSAIGQELDSVRKFFIITFRSLNAVSSEKLN